MRWGVRGDENKKRIQSQLKAIDVFLGVEGNSRGDGFEGGCNLRAAGGPK